MEKNNIIIPDWDIPPQVRAVVTTRVGGHSQTPYDSFNLGTHVQDNPTHVKQNRALLKQQLNIESEPVWLNQVHEDTVISLNNPRSLTADAAFASTPHQICTIMSADCLPILMCDVQGSWVAAIHGGWRSLAKNIIPKTLLHYPDSAKRITVWLGPAIGQCFYEVGQEVYDAFCSQDNIFNSAFTPLGDKYLCDIKVIASIQCQACGVEQITVSDYDTHGQDALFYSYRRDGQTGRMASLIWLNYD